MASAITFSSSSRILILVLVAVSLAISNARNVSEEEYLELKRQLKLLNKPAVKSIKTEYGDIFDCVDMYKQPALDHPLLKNHTIQIKPTSFPKGMENQDNSNASLEITIGLKDGGCPFGTVPIRRTKMQDLLRAKSLSDFGRKKVVLAGNHHYALAFSRGQVYGTKANMNAWAPLVPDQRQFSTAQCWIENGPDDQLNGIETGWIVHPEIFGDTHPRLYVSWTADGYKKTGCLNQLCPGYVQVSKDIPIGGIVDPVSTYNGRQWEIILQVFKDPRSGNWWLGFGKNIPLGYFPKSLFTSLADSASKAGWGGEVYTPQGIKGPEMGSGHFPDEGFGKAAYMKLLKTVDKANILRDIPFNVPLNQDVTQCYKVIDGGYLDNDWRRNIYFGGPGGC